MSGSPYHHGTSDAPDLTHSEWRHGPVVTVVPEPAPEPTITETVVEVEDAPASEDTAG